MHTYTHTHIHTYIHTYIHISGLPVAAALPRLAPVALFPKQLEPGSSLCTPVLLLLLASPSSMEHGEPVATATEHGTYAIEDGAMVSEANATEHGLRDGAIAFPLPETVPLNELRIEVEFKNDMWWTMPPGLSTGILSARYDGFQEVAFIWNWGDVRDGSFRPDGETTSINRYIIDFTSMYQRNIDNNRTRKVRVVHVVR